MSITADKRLDGSANKCHVDYGSEIGWNPGSCVDSLHLVCFAQASFSALYDEEIGCQRLCFSALYDEEIGCQRLSTRACDDSIYVLTVT